MKSCRQDYSKRKEITAELEKFGTVEGYYTIDHPDVLVKARDMALTPEMPDIEELGKNWQDISKDKYP